MEPLRAGSEQGPFFTFKPPVYVPRYQTWVPSSARWVRPFGGTVYTITLRHSYPLILVHWLRPIRAPGSLEPVVARFCLVNRNGCTPLLVVHAPRESQYYQCNVCYGSLHSNTLFRPGGRGL
eukprot:8225160-Heterocapsa_arctica.AAC.2